MLFSKLVRELVVASSRKFNPVFRLLVVVVVVDLSIEVLIPEVTGRMFIKYKSKLERLFLHLFNKLILSTYYVPGTVLMR